MALRTHLGEGIHDIAIRRFGALAVGVVSLGLGLLTLCLSWESGVLLVDSGLDEVRLVMEP